MTCPLCEKCGAPGEERPLVRICAECLRRLLETEARIGAGAARMEESLARRA